MNSDRIKKILGKLQRRSGAAVVVMGDIILDEYTQCEQDYSPNEDCTVLRRQNSLLFPGNALNVCLNIDAMEGKAAVLGTLGIDREADELRRLTGGRVNLDGLLADSGRSTTVKSRLCLRDGSLIRVDREDNTPVSPQTAAGLLAQAEACGDVRCAVVSDLGKGLFPGSCIGSFIGWARRKGIPALVDPAGSKLERYAGASVLFPNLLEFNRLTSSAFQHPAEAVQKAREQMRKYDIGAIVLKAGENGSCWITNREALHLPALGKQPVCEVGAGDSCIAAFAVGTGCGLSEEECFLLGSAAAAVSISKAYTSAVSLSELIRFSTAMEPVSVYRL
ncbi:bifunctional heptose 7-phosphate kinase/heptose 1-phosphate adenyltransferase [Paenibacillus lutrae]|uniref:Carbohydrate kinase PfkB domain-containing protein n=1 Tax=Paenibacillus lutrae TaxID=2078573 RepID=A0A7X3FFM2_9BACL|nr:PfkB family carbohydrate kinase [Paenibacillus lutrae]MVO98843.1 hypothetical protein [Paenibacillus lutrae]